MTLDTLYYLFYHPYLIFVNINYRSLPFVSLRTSFVFISVLKLIIKINHNIMDKKKKHTMICNNERFFYFLKIIADVIY